MMEPGSTSSRFSSSEVSAPTKPTSMSPVPKSACLQSVRRNRNLWILINVFSVVAWMFGMSGTFHCSFLIVETLGTDKAEEAVFPIKNNLTSSPDSKVEHPVGLGLYSSSVYDLDSNFLGCVSYYDNDFDAAFRASRAFGMMVALATTAAMICVGSVSLFLESKPWKRRLWTAARFLFFAAFLCQLLTFVAFGRELCNRADMTCRPGSASVLSILNLFILLVQSALIYIIPPASQPIFYLRDKGKPMSVVVRQPHEVHGEGQPGFEMEEGFEILSSAPSQPGTSTTSKQQFQRTNNNDVSEHELLEQEALQTPSMIVEGIECVAADHTRKKGRLVPKSCWQNIKDKYYSLGHKKGFRATMAGILFLSWVFIIKSVTGCTFMLVGAVDQARDEYNGLGLFNRAYYMHDDILGCIAYPPAAKNHFDGAFVVGRAFAIITFILITASFASFTVLHGFWQSTRTKEVAWLSLTQITLPCAWISHLVSFSAFDTQSCTQIENVECVPGLAGAFAILNVFLILALALFIFALPCPNQSIFRMRTSGHSVLSSVMWGPFWDPTSGGKSKKLQDEDHAMESTGSISHSHTDSDYEVTGNITKISPLATTETSYAERGASKRNSLSIPSAAGAEESVEVFNATDILQDLQNMQGVATEEIRHSDAPITLITQTDEVAKLARQKNESQETQPPAKTPPKAPLSKKRTGKSSKTPSEDRGASKGIPSTIRTVTISSRWKDIPSSDTWDSGASVEQFETVDLEILSESTNNSTQEGKDDPVLSQGKSQAALVKDRAMAIMKEMMEEEEKRELLRKKKVPISMDDEDDITGSQSSTSLQTQVVARSQSISTYATGDNPYDNMTSSNTYSTTNTGASSIGAKPSSSAALPSRKSSFGVSSTGYATNSSRSDDGVTFESEDAIKYDVDSTTGSRYKVNSTKQN